MPNYTILLVDDEEDMLRVIGGRIKSWDYSLIEAKNGREALESIKANPADVVVLDYMLPDMDGIEVLKGIRKINKKVPVIMFTAYPNPTSMREAEKLNISAYVAKLSDYTDTHLLLKAAIDMAIKKTNTSRRS
ncbi:MAG: response regulator [Candidatus Omnitrophica bacterium]|jgi:CheY-like chemotaxis protein|nr:response regulator [Candidatus Omnitrophota bacterium]MDD4981911.1 response regulator [Candidatus Omnitrophota bacterium]MDD5665405.1 response regulator [Candidatus Omnitrophota bacterium]